MDEETAAAIQRGIAALFAWFAGGNVPVFASACVCSCVDVVHRLSTGRPKQIGNGPRI
jgi:hypothetical protein